MAGLTGKLGALQVIDADLVVRQALSTPGLVVDAVEREFGSSVLAEDGSVDRSRLAAIVFADEPALRRLEAILHPEVRRRIGATILALDRHSDGGIVTVEAIRLLQSPLAEMASRIWVVVCEPAIQHQRLVELRGYGEAEAAARIQASPSFEASQPTVTIVNNGSMADLEQAVTAAWQDFVNSE